MKQRASNFSETLAKIRRAIRPFQAPAVTQVAQKSRDPFRVLISCLISLRTKDEVTDTASKRLFEKADTPAQMLQLREREIAKLIFPAGFYRTKARHIREILPKRYWIPINDWLVTFGQNVCQPVSPRCSKCPLDKGCPKIGVRYRR